MEIPVEGVLTSACILLYLAQLHGITGHNNVEKYSATFKCNSFKTVD